MSADERVDAAMANGPEAAVISNGSIERTHAPPRARSLRRVPAPIERIDGPDARIADLARGALGRIASRPLTAAVLALGVGFIVGGALSFRAGRVALAAAGRHILRELLKQVL